MLFNWFLCLIDFLNFSITETIATVLVTQNQMCELNDSPPSRMAGNRIDTTVRIPCGSHSDKHQIATPF